MYEAVTEKKCNYLLSGMNCVCQVSEIMLVER
jgi:hypothetical protein